MPVFYAKVDYFSSQTYLAPLSAFLARFRSICRQFLFFASNWQIVTVWTLQNQTLLVFHFSLLLLNTVFFFVYLSVLFFLWIHFFASTTNNRIFFVNTSMWLYSYIFEVFFGFSRDLQFSSLLLDIFSSLKFYADILWLLDSGFVVTTNYILRLYFSIKIFRRIFQPISCYSRVFYQHHLI